MVDQVMIWVTFALPGFHCYPNAPEDVKYLREIHRHLFKFKVGVSVNHDNRDIEFHQFLRYCTTLYGSELNVDHKSCEMIARELVGHISHKYGSERIVVEVWEDDECGATVEHRT